MEGIHSADLGTCGKSEARAPTGQQVPQKQSQNASWCPILDLPQRIFDAARFYWALKPFKMPKYNTVHDVFPHLYLFWRNPIINPQLYILQANCISGYGWKSFHQLRSFIQDQNYPIRPWKSLIPIVCDQWDLSKSDFFECIERSRWKYSILVRRIGGIEFDWAESYTFDAVYIYLICTYVILQCKLGRECELENYDTCLLYFYQTFSHFSRYSYIQRDCMILRSDAFITENAELQSCFMPALS